MREKRNTDGRLYTHMKNSEANKFIELCDVTSTPRSTMIRSILVQWTNENYDRIMNKYKVGVAA